MSIFSFCSISHFLPIPYQEGPHLTGQWSPAPHRQSLVGTADTTVSGFQPEGCWARESRELSWFTEGFRLPSLTARKVQGTSMLMGLMLCIIWHQLPEVELHPQKPRTNLIWLYYAKPLKRALEFLLRAVHEGSTSNASVFSPSIYLCVCGYIYKALVVKCHWQI